MTTTDKTPHITGITGQVGAAIAKFLLKKGHVVQSIKRRASLFNTDRIDHQYENPPAHNRNFILHYSDLTDSTSVVRIVRQMQPHEISNLAAQSQVAGSFQEPDYADMAGGMAALRVLEAIQILSRENTSRFFKASTSDLYALVQEIPQKETTPFYPRSPLQRGKAEYLLDEDELPRNLRNVCLQRHPVQPKKPYPQRKLRHPQDHQRDRAYRAGPARLPHPVQRERAAPMGHARDYVKMQWLIPQQHWAEDFVIATGLRYSVQESTQLTTRMREKIKGMQGQEH